LPFTQPLSIVTDNEWLVDRMFWPRDNSKGSTRTRPVQVVEKAAREMGLWSMYDRSGVSEAEYLTVSGGIATGDPAEAQQVSDSVRIRFASHESHPNHAKSDFHVGKGKGHRAVTGDHWDAIRWLAKRFGREIPAWATPEEVATRAGVSKAAATTRASNTKAKEGAIIRELTAEWRGQKGIVASSREIALQHQLSDAAAKRIRKSVIERRRITRIEVLYEPVAQADRPKGFPRKAWDERTKTPYRLRLVGEESPSKPVYYESQERAQAARAKLAEFYGLETQVRTEQT
jgi:hypothetical protein